MLAVTAVLLGSGSGRLDAQPDADGTECRYYNHGPDGTRFSPLDQTNRSNVAYLVEVWSHSGGGPIVPIVADGVMNMSTPAGVDAVETESGEAVGPANCGAVTGRKTLAPAWATTANSMLESSPSRSREKQNETRRGVPPDRAAQPDIVSPENGKHV